MQPAVKQDFRDPMRALLPRRQITPQERETYERDGIVCLRGIFPLEWLAFLSTAIEEAMASPGPHAEDFESADGSGRFFGDLELAERLGAFRRFALESPAAEIAGQRWLPRTYSTATCSGTGSSGSQIEHTCLPLTAQYGWSWCQGVRAAVPGSLTSNWS